MFVVSFILFFANTQLSHRLAFCLATTNYNLKIINLVTTLGKLLLLIRINYLS